MEHNTVRNVTSFPAALAEGSREIYNEINRDVGRVLVYGLKGMNGMKKKTSFRKRYLHLIFLLFVPMALCLVAYNVYTVHYVTTEKIAEGNQNRLEVFAGNLESDLQDITTYMESSIVSDTDFRVLQHKVGKLNAHLSSYNILQKFKNILSMKSIVTCFFLSSDKNEFYQTAFHESIPAAGQMELRGALTEYVKKGDIDKRGWFILTVEGKPYFLRALGFGGAYQICVIDMEQVLSEIAIDREGGEYILFADGGQSIISGYAETGLPILDSVRQAYYTDSAGESLYAMHRSIGSTKIDFVLLVPYGGLLENMDGVQLLLLALSALLLLAFIPCGFIFLRRSLFSPVARLVNTMERIKAGDWKAKMDDDSPIEEFDRMSGTFNEMVEEITKLKIVAYEQTLKAQQSQLNYIHMQIRPHFYLNCLKKLYGMAQVQDVVGMQEMILRLSDYFRGMFSKNEVFTTLEAELHNAETFVALQSMDLPGSIRLVTEIGPELSGFAIPPLSVLTFVENAVKHGKRIGVPLLIRIRAVLLHTEEGNYANISIIDNGPGFSKEELKDLNSAADPDRGGDGYHIGIGNIKQRFSLLYGDAASLTFTQRGGADVEIFLPYPPAKDQDLREMGGTV